MPITTIFNSREISILFWALVLLSYLLYNRKTRSSIRNVVIAFFGRHILAVYTLMVLYIGYQCFLLMKVNLWNITLLKSTILWALTAASVSVFQIDKISREEGYFKDAIKDNFKIALALEFVINFYSQSLILEIIIVPFFALLGGMLAIAQREEKYRSAENLIYFIFSIYLLFLVYSFINHVSGDYKSFVNSNTLSDFFFPIYMSLAYLPFIYFLSIYIIYADVSIRLQFVIKDPSLIRYARLKAALNFRTDARSMERWFKSLHLKHAETKVDVNKSIKDFKQQLKRERNPEEVIISEGWAPQKARFYLQSHEMIAGHYNAHSDDFWFASSPPLEIGKGIIPNNITYYIEGTERAATSLKLKLNVNKGGSTREAQDTLCTLAQTLLLSCMGNMLTSPLSGSNSTEREYYPHYPRKGCQCSNRVMAHRQRLHHSIYHSKQDVNFEAFAIPFLSPSQVNSTNTNLF